MMSIHIVVTAAFGAGMQFVPASFGYNRVPRAIHSSRESPAREEGTS